MNAALLTGTDNIRTTPARVYGRYEILGELGRGGMGTVYLAQLSGEGGFSRLFGLKVSHQHLDEEACTRLVLREARLAARIHHPNVVSTVDFGMHEGTYYLLLDYIEGISLGHVLKAAPKSAARLIVPCVRDALLGLHAAHTLVDYDGTPASILHQDVSPDNILIGVDGIARITDFGIARELRKTTQAKSLRGKTPYMAPELFLGSRVDVRADIWSMGVVLWNALTGFRLFAAKTPAGTIHNILHQPIPLPSTVGLKPPPAFDAIVMRALARNPDERYGSAAEMADALEEAARSIQAFASRREVGRWVLLANPRELRRRRELIKRARGLVHNAQGEELDARSPVSGIHPIATPPTLSSSAVHEALEEPATVGLKRKGMHGATRKSLPPPPPAHRPSTQRLRSHALTVAALALAMALGAWLGRAADATTPRSSSYETAEDSAVRERAADMGLRLSR